MLSARVAASSVMFCSLTSHRMPCPLPPAQAAAAVTGFRCLGLGIHRLAVPLWTAEKAAAESQLLCWGAASCRARPMLLQGEAGPASDWRCVARSPPCWAAALPPPPAGCLKLRRLRREGVRPPPEPPACCRGRPRGAASRGSSRTVGTATPAERATNVKESELVCRWALR